MLDNGFQVSKWTLHLFSEKHKNLNMIRVIPWITECSIIDMN